MPSTVRRARPQAVLFACDHNAVRSPMAAGIARSMFGRSVYVASAGVRAGELDRFAVAVLGELDIDISRHRPKTFAELDDWEGLSFDLIVTLTPEAHHRALELTRTLAAEVEYWPTGDPAAAEGPREQRLAAYRAIRDQLIDRITARFAPPPGGNE